MATTEGKKISIKTEGLEKNGLLGDAKLPKGNEPVTKSDVSNIVNEVKNSFSKFTQTQLTYAQAENNKTDSTSSDSSSATSTEQSQKSETLLSKTTETLGSVIPAIGSVKAAVNNIQQPVNMMKNMLGVNNITSILWNGLKSVFSKLFSSPLFLIGLVLGGTLLYKTVIKPHLGKIKEWISKVKEKAVGIWNKVKEIYETKIKSFIQICVEYFNKAKGFLGDIGTKVGDFFKGFDFSIFTKIFDYIKEVMPTITELCGKIPPLVQKVKDFYNGVLDWKEKISDFINDIKDAYHDVMDPIINFVNKFIRETDKTITSILHPFEGDAMNAQKDADLIKSLNKEGTDLAKRKNELEEQLKNSKDSREQERLMKEIERTNQGFKRLQEKIKTYNLSDDEIKEAKKKDKSLQTNMFDKATKANKTNSNMSDSVGTTKLQNTSQDILFKDKVKATISDDGTKTVALTPEQNAEFEARIKKVFAKNLERIKGSREKRGEKFDEKKELEKMKETIMMGIDKIAKSTDKLADGQLSDADLKSALSYATRGGNKQPVKVVVQPPKEPTPPRSVQINK